MAHQVNRVCGLLRCRWRMDDLLKLPGSINLFTYSLCGVVSPFSTQRMLLILKLDFLLCLFMFTIKTKTGFLKIRSAIFITVTWLECHDMSNDHQPDCLFSSLHWVILLRRSKLHTTIGFPSQMASNEESISLSWHHHVEWCHLANIIWTHKNHRNLKENMSVFVVSTLPADGSYHLYIFIIKCIYRKISNIRRT